MDRPHVERLPQHAPGPNGGDRGHEPPLASVEAKDPDHDESERPGKRHRVEGEFCLARGSLTGVEVHPRDVFRPLIRGAAAAVIFCHNHPSGDPAPSRQDVELTARLREVGELVGIPVLDHLVVGWEGYVSLAERGWR